MEIHIGRKCSSYSGYERGVGKIAMLYKATSGDCAGELNGVCWDYIVFSNANLVIYIEGAALSNRWKKEELRKLSAEKIDSIILDYLLPLLDAEMMKTVIHCVKEAGKHEGRVNLQAELSTEFKKMKNMLGDFIY